MRKERRKENPPTPASSRYIQCRLADWNHSPYFDVLCASFHIILLTTCRIVINTTNRQHQRSQCIRQLTYHHTVFRHHLAAFSYRHRISQRLHVTRSLLPSHLPRYHSFVPFVSSVASCGMSHTQHPPKSLPDVIIILPVTPDLTFTSVFDRMQCTDWMVIQGFLLKVGIFLVLWRVDGWVIIWSIL